MIPWDSALLTSITRKMRKKSKEVKKSVNHRGHRGSQRNLQPLARSNGSYAWTVLCAGRSFSRAELVRIEAIQQREFVLGWQE